MKIYCKRKIMGKAKKKLSLFKLLDLFKKKEIYPDILPAFPIEFTGGQTVSKTELKKDVKLVTDHDLLKTMCVIREFENHLSVAFQEGELPTEAIHLSIGQEAVAAGVCMNLRDSDYLNTTHRGARSYYCQRGGPESHDGRTLRQSRWPVCGKRRIHARN